MGPTFENIPKNVDKNDLNLTFLSAKLCFFKDSLPKKRRSDSEALVVLGTPKNDQGVASGSTKKTQGQSWWDLKLSKGWNLELLARARMHARACGS